MLEDDYDAEFRYDRQPVGSLHGLAPDVVIHAGSTSKTLAPGLRLGWLVLPAALQATLPGTPPVVDQLALADLIERATSTATCAATAASTRAAAAPCSTPWRGSSPRPR